MAAAPVATYNSYSGYGNYGGYGGYGNVRTTSYGLTDYNRDGIPDQWEGYNRWGSYPHHYSGYNMVGNHGWW